MIMVYILIFIYSADPCLCQDLDSGEPIRTCLDKVTEHDNDLASLKTRLKKEVFTFQLAHEDHKQWSSIIKQVTRSPSARVLEECSDITESELARLYSIDNKLYMRAGETCNILRECTRKMRVTEGMVKHLDSNFKSSIKKEWHEISTGETLAQLELEIREGAR
jgi:hypothetical protein